MKQTTMTAEAGMAGSITTATSMAGRGTDIKPGGDYEMRLSLEPGIDPDHQIAA